MVWIEWAFLISCLVACTLAPFFVKDGKVPKSRWDKE